MSPRELVILILGLAIVAVVLRGLYVALQARRGQIRLAIDKNIPKDIDLNALEMAELPSGGARIVERSLAEVNRQNHAAKKAQAMNLADQAAPADPIPVLMDPVELHSEPESVPTGLPANTADDFSDSAPIEPSHMHYDNETEAEEYLSDEDPAEYQSYAEQDPADISDDEETAVDDPDSVLFDYGEPVAKVDNLSQVTPDYNAVDGGDDEFDEDDDYANDYDEYDDDQIDEDADDDDFDDEFEDDEEVDDDDYDDDVDEDRDDDLDDDEYDDDDEESDEDSYDDYDPLDDDDLIDDDSDDDLNFADDDLDDFSMTAGERIGYAPANKPLTQPELFSEEEAPKPAVAKPRRKPLFATLGRKLMQKALPGEPTPTEAVKPKAAKTVAPVSEPPATLDVEATEEPVVAATPEPPVVVVAKPKAQEVAARPAQPRVSSVADTTANRSGKTEPANESVAAEPSEVVVLNVMAKPGRVIGGDDLLHVLITSGMKFGDMNIFHRRLGGDNKGPIIFSIANILNPGTFDLNKMHEFTTLGVSLFLALPTSINNLEALNQMLTVADQICEAFDAELRDDNRNLMTAQTIEHYRQRIRDFELRRLKAVGARG